MPLRLNFNMKNLEALKGRKVRYYAYDEKTRGLCLVVHPTGNKAFFLERKFQGRSERIKIGDFPEWSVKEARGEAGKWISEFAHGKSPAEARRSLRGELTLADLWAEFKSRHLEPYRKPKTVAEYERQLNVHLHHWHRKKLTAIKKRDVQSLHGKLGKENGGYLANRVVSLIRALYNKAADWGYIESSYNPAVGIQRYKETSRERFLKAEELPAFFKALAEEQDVTARDCITMCLMSGARRGSVQRMRWDELDLVKATWLIGDGKTGSQTVVLPIQAVEILKERKANMVDETWVFPSPRREGPYRDLKGPWARIVKRAGLKDLRLHDLRRSLGSWQAALGSSLAIVGKSLGHRTLSTTMIYARLQEDPVRQSVQRAVDVILRTGTEQNVGSKKVVDFTK